MGKHFLFLILWVSTQAFAASGANFPFPLETAEAPSAKDRGDEKRFRIQAGISSYLSLGPGNTFFGVGYSLGSTYRLHTDLPLHVGLESSYISSTDLGSLVSTGGLFPSDWTANTQLLTFTLSQVLPTVLIRKEKGWFHPYAGASLGPVFASVRGRYVRTGEEATASPIYLAIAVRAGADFDIAGPLGMSFEPLRFMWISGSVSWGPLLNLVARF